MCTDTARYARASTGLDVPLSFPFVRVMKEGKRRRRGKEEKGRTEYDKLFNKINREHVVSCVNGVDSPRYVRPSCTSVV